MGQQMYQSKTLVLVVSTRKASMYRRVEDYHFTTSIFRRIQRTSPLIQSKFSHCVESIFFSQDSRVSYLDFSPEARLPRTSWIDGESRPSSPFMGPFPYYSAMLNSVSDSESLTDSTSSSETAKRTRVRVDWSRDETNILLDCWGALYESLKSASVKQRKTLWSQILKRLYGLSVSFSIRSSWKKTDLLVLLSQLKRNQGMCEKNKIYRLS